MPFLRIALGKIPVLALTCAGMADPASAAPAKGKAPVQPTPAPASAKIEGATLLARGKIVPGAPDAFLYKFTNGLKLIVVPDDRNPVASFRAQLDAGSNREVRGKTGLAHFFEHMMFRKTKATEEGHFDRTLAGVGGRGNAGTGTDMVVYYETFPGPALEAILELEAQRFLGVELKDPYFSTEKGAVISERKLRVENDPAQRAQEALRARIEAGTPYEWMTIGEKSDVENMSIADAQAFFDRHYVPQNTLMAVGGPFPADEIARAVSRRFSAWNGKAPPEHFPLPKDYFTRHAGKSFVCAEAVAAQNLQIIYPTKETGLKETVIAGVVSEMLDDHPEGTFARRLQKAQAANAFYFFKTAWQREAQPLVAYFVLNREQPFAPARELWEKALQELLKKPLDAAFKNRLRKQIEVQDAEVAQRMTSLLETAQDNEAMFGDFRAGAERAQIVSALTEAEVRAWIRARLAPQNAFVSGVVASGKAEPCGGRSAPVPASTGGNTK